MKLRISTILGGSETTRVVLSPTLLCQTVSGLPIPVVGQTRCTFCPGGICCGASGRPAPMTVFPGDVFGRDKSVFTLAGSIGGDHKWPSISVLRRKHLPNTLRVAVLVQPPVAAWQVNVPVSSAVALIVESFGSILLSGFSIIFPVQLNLIDSLRKTQMVSGSIGGIGSSREQPLPLRPTIWTSNSGTPGGGVKT